MRYISTKQQIAEKIFQGNKPVPFKRATGQSIGFGPTNTAEQTDAFFSSSLKASLVGAVLKSKMLQQAPPVS
jgi:predicted transcriptional regulator